MLDVRVPGLAWVVGRATVGWNDWIMTDSYLCLEKRELLTTGTEKRHQKNLEANITIQAHTQACRRPG